MKVLVTPTSFRKSKDSPAKTLLESFADTIVYNPFDRPLTEDEILPLLEGIDGYIAGLDYITQSVIEKAPASLKVISRYGAGYDRVDIQAANEKGIVVTNTPGVNSQSVADLALGLILAVARKIPSLDKRVKSGEWPRYTGFEIYGKTLGIIGLGAIGKAVAVRAKGFCMDILAYDPYIDKMYAANNNITVCTLEEAFKKSDIISLHLPLNNDTHHIVDHNAISLMKDGAVLINTSRGGLIDEAAAYEALKSGKLGGLGVDAFEKEPPGQSPLFELENVVATPHSGAHTVEAVNNMANLSVQNLIDVLSGKECKFIVKSV